MGRGNFSDIIRLVDPAKLTNSKGLPYSFCPKSFVEGNIWNLYKLCSPPWRKVFLRWMRVEAKLVPTMP
jgi:hypothetical protein